MLKKDEPKFKVGDRIKNKFSAAKGEVAGYRESGEGSRGYEYYIKYDRHNPSWVNEIALVLDDDYGHACECKHAEKQHKRSGCGECAHEDEVDNAWIDTIFVYKS